MAHKIYDAEAQFLTIAYAKDVGLDRQNRVVYFDANEKSREEAGLSALLVYSVVAPAYTYYTRMLVAASSPMSISSLLAIVWSKKAGLGMPIMLEVKPQLLSADRGYATWIRSVGVELSSPPSLKSITAFERSSLDVWFAAQWRDEGEAPRRLDRANEAIQEYDIFSTNYHSRKSMEVHTFEVWNARDKCFFDGNPLETDWDASALAEKERPRPSAELIVHADDDPAIFVEGIKEISEMWPGGRRAFLGNLTLSKKEFDFWVAGRANLHQSDFEQMRELANIDYRDEYDEWELGGGYLLIATTSKNVISAYNTLSHGGDLRFSFEVLGPNGELPALRFLVFEPWGGTANIILFERGGSIEMALNERNLINLQDAVHAPPDIWKTVTTIVDFREKFDEPGKVGDAFSAKYDGWLSKMSRGKFGFN
jgi:hypothetical protein